jgi:hypothetical protein
MLYGGFKCTYDFQPEIKRGKLFFVSMGSGQPLADPFLAFVKRVLWKDQTPTVDAAKIGVYWALSHTIDCASGLHVTGIAVTELIDVDSTCVYELPLCAV